MRKMFLITILAITLLTGCGGVPKSQGSTTVQTTTQPTTQTTTKEERKPVEWKATLYFSDKEGMKLIKRVRLVEADGVMSVEKKAESCIDALIKGDQDAGLMTSIPQTAKVLSVKSEGDTLVVDFSKEFEKDHIGGSTGIFMTMAPLVLTLTELPGVKQVSFKIEGKTLDEFKGHIAFDKPFKRTEFEQYIENIDSLKQIPTKKNEEHSKLTLYMPDDKALEMYSMLPNSKILLTKFEKKDWGTWNIKGWYMCEDKSIPTQKSYLLAGGGSDWEYVFRVIDDKKLPYEFSGGNHGNEILKSLKLINNNSNEEINLKPGEKSQLDSLKVIEDTSLTIRNDSKKKYANVQRVYQVFPSKIILDTKFQFISDIYMGTSYVCMLPIEKSYGRYAKFEAKGNIYKTPKVGETLTTEKFENYLGKEKTMAVELWGDANPSYRFNIRIGSEEMVDYFKNDLKVFYWDFNKGGNKLYFSKYNSIDYNKITSGTTWNNNASWEFNIKTTKGV